MELSLLWPLLPTAGEVPCEEVRPSGSLLGQHLLFPALCCRSVWDRACSSHESTHSISRGCCTGCVLHVLVDLFWVHV